MKIARGLLLIFLGVVQGVICKPIRVLHLSYHQGCIQDIDTMARALGLVITVWNPLVSKSEAARFLGTQDSPMSLYNMTHDRAHYIWNMHKEYFDSFDMVITSDITPIARIFLQNGWAKPLIIWVCNRFNYCVGPGSSQGMDAEYYDLIQYAASSMPKVKIIAYTPFEHYFAALYKTDIRGPIIKPLGSREGVCTVSAIPVNIIKNDTIFVWPGYGGVKGEYLSYIQNKCASLGFSTYSGRYNGPDDLKGFKAVIYFPYQASNLALFENIQRGVVHFVPSERFITDALRRGEPIYYWHEPYHCEWYYGEHRDILIYFDSWQDLAYKITTTDYDTMRKRIKAFGEYHRNEMLDRWRSVLHDLAML